MRPSLGLYVRLSLYVVTVLVIVAASVWTDGARNPSGARHLPDCVTEDDPNDCYWDANKRGNQQGSSFIHYRGNYYLLDT